jgi:hypothetical protein
MPIGKVPTWTSTNTATVASTKGAPILPDLDEEKVLPKALLDIAPLDRHLWFFKVAAQLGSKPASQINVDTSDHFLDFKDMDTGLKKLGMNGAEAALLSIGVLADRGGRQLLKGQGGFDKMDISPGALWGTAHGTNARSGVYDKDGNIDEAKENAFLTGLDPSGKDHITMDDFKRVGAAIVKQNDGDGLLAGFKRWKDEGTFDRAWSSFMKLAAHTDENGKQFVTQNDVRWFFDGTLFFRKAQA